MLRLWHYTSRPPGRRNVSRPAAGHRPRSGGRTRSEWLHVYGFARPATGGTVAATPPRVAVERMAEAFSGVAAHPDPDGTEVLVRVGGWAAERAAGRRPPRRAALHARVPAGR